MLPPPSRYLTEGYYSTYGVCKILGMDHKAYRRYEGKLSPVVRRNPRNGFRIFSEVDVEELKRLWKKGEKAK